MDMITVLIPGGFKPPHVGHYKFFMHYINNPEVSEVRIFCGERQRKVGDNFAAGMTGGMAFIYDKSKEFDKKVNPDSVIWQGVETEYWKNFLKKLILEHYKETNSLLSKDLIDNFEKEINNFVQVCPKEMVNKLEYPITMKSGIKEVS